MLAYILYFLDLNKNENTTKQSLNWKKSYYEKLVLKT